MIVGSGVDLAEVLRIKASIQRYAYRALASGLDAPGGSLSRDIR